LPAIAGGGATPGEGPARSSGLRHALVIDDEPDVAASLSDILELMGVKSRVVASWTSAADVLNGHMPPDIVFSDLRMPGISGIAIYRELLGQQPPLAKRFVLVTGDMIGAKAEIEALPPQQRPHILEKPFSTLDVRGILSTVADEAAATADNGAHI
jgi:CheY-like chemotaxis protein